MNYNYFYLNDKEGKSNCVVRSFCKIYDMEYDDVSKKLLTISEELNCNFNDIETFEKFYDKKDFYHMVPVINKTVYDYNNESLKLYVISIYKVNP